MPRIAYVILLSSLLVLTYFESASAPKLVQREVSALEQILVKMGTSPKNLTLECGYKETINCTCVGEVCHVISLHLKDRNLPGRLGVELVNLEYLEDVSLTANRLSGKIPKEWESFPNLTYLSLEANNFSGHVPSELGNLASLQDLILSSNNFVGTLPKSLANLKNLTALRINDNRFEGNIPEFIGNFSTKLKRLEICGSGMRGPVPTAIFQLEKLTDLRITDLKGNKTGFRSIASEKLNNLVLRNLNLSGTIPTVVWNLTELDFLFLSGNNLTEDVPDKFLTSTAFIDLSYNNFTWSTSSCKDNIEDKINKYRSSRSKNQLTSFFHAMIRHSAVHLMSNHFI